GQSRYRALLEAEAAVRTGLWENTGWRRLRLEDGRLSEASPAATAGPCGACPRGRPGRAAGPNGSPTERGVKNPAPGLSSAPATRRRPRPRQPPRRGVECSRPARGPGRAAGHTWRSSGAINYGAERPARPVDRGDGGLARF